MHCLSLSFTPTFLIGLNKDFKIPNKFTTTCNAKVRLMTSALATDGIVNGSGADDCPPACGCVCGVVDGQPSVFAYPKKLEEKKEDKKERVTTAVLSTTAKAKVRGQLGLVTTHYRVLSADGLLT
jgi:26S proteasome regulatory subunit N2